MKAIARVAAAFVCVVYGSAMFPSMLSSRSYEFQDREHPSSPPTGEFLLGTDALGRDRLSRLLHGARISLVLAPAAALLATVLAAFAGSLSLFFNPRMSSSMQAVVDLVISVPWLFLMLAIRALIPLNVSAWASVVVTFAVLGLLGWAPAVRVFQAAASHS
jgi:ABC-type dipeptide/oligopeptide/nickel transport system permease subunit